MAPESLRGDVATKRGRLVPVVVLVGLLTTLGACSADPEGAATPTSTTPTTPTTPTTQPTFPGVRWDTEDPGRAGLDPTRLESLAEEAEAAGSSCLVVVKDGKVVVDHAWPGPEARPREVFSATKSVASTLVGIAEARGELDITQSASDFIPEWKGTDAETVTVEDILSNTSGRQWDAGTDYNQMAVRAPDKTAFAISLGMEARPGEVWAYNNSAIQTLDAVLETATSIHPSDFVEEVLLGPIGMQDSDLRRDSAGNALTFMGLSSTCLDMARFGHLFLRHGDWAGEQVVPADWVEAATSPSSDLTASYGYLWWLNRKGRLASAAVATEGRGGSGVPVGQMLPGAAESIYWALGLGDQVVAVLPDEGIVAVRLGDPPPKDRPFGYKELTAGVLEAAGSG